MSCGKCHQRFFVEMLLITLQYYLMFLLKQYVTIALAYLTGNLFFKICSPVEVMSISKKIKQWETVFKTCFDTSFLI